MSELKPKITTTQEQILQSLVANGGTSAYRHLIRLCYGINWSDVSRAERVRLGTSVQGLERRGLVAIQRRWGTLGYGQPELVTITEHGRQLVQPAGEL